MHWIKRFLKSEDGPTAVEYAVILALLFLACVAAIQAVGGAAAGSLDNSKMELEDKIGSPPTS